MTEIVMCTLAHLPPLSLGQLPPLCEQGDRGQHETTVRSTHTLRHIHANWRLGTVYT